MTDVINAVEADKLSCDVYVSNKERAQECFLQHIKEEVIYTFNNQIREAIKRGDRVLCFSYRVGIPPSYNDIPVEIHRQIRGFLVELGYRPLGGYDVERRSPKSLKKFKKQWVVMKKVVSSEYELSGGIIIRW